MAWTKARIDMPKQPSESDIRFLRPAIQSAKTMSLGVLVVRPPFLPPHLAHYKRKASYTKGYTK